MKNEWIVVVRSKEYGNVVFRHQSPKEQIESAGNLLANAQKHHAVDTIQRVVIAIPDPYRGNQEIEEFISSYLSI